MVQKKSNAILSQSCAEVAIKDAKVTIQFEFALQDIDKEYQQELNKVATQTKISGFRKGKAKNHIEKREGLRVRAQSIEQLLDREVKAIAKANSHDVASTPTVKDSSGDGVSEPLKMTVEYEIFPEINNVDLAKIKLDGVSAKVTAQDVADEIARIQDHLAEWKAADKPAEKGLRLKIDYVGRIDGEMFEGGSATDQYMSVGESQYMPEFEKALGKSKKGDVCKFDVVFPADYHGKEVAGKTAQFEVNVQGVEEKAPRAMNKEFYKAAGVDVKTKAEFEKELKVRLESDVDYLVEAVNRRRLLKQLQSDIKLVLPQSVVDAEVKHTLEQEKDMDEKKARQVVISNIERALIVKHYMQAYNVKAAPQEIKAHIEMMAPPQVGADQFFQWYVQDQNRIQQAQSTLLEQKTLSEVLNKVDLKAKNVSIKDVEAELKESM